MTIITDYGNFKLLRKDRTAAYIPGCTSFTESVAIQAYVDNAEFRIYRVQPSHVALFEVASTTLNRLEVSVKNHIWNRLSDKLKHNSIYLQMFWSKYSIFQKR